MTTIGNKEQLFKDVFAVCSTVEEAERVASFCCLPRYTGEIEAWAQALDNASMYWMAAVYPATVKCFSELLQEARSSAAGELFT